MDIDQTPTAPKADAGDKMDTDESAVKTEGDGEKKAEEEAKALDKPEGLKRKMEKEKVGFPDECYEPVKKPTVGLILLNDTKPSESKTLLEMKEAKKGATREANREASGVADAAGVLTALDEGGEGEKDAEVPHEFENQSDNE
ncbi:hypothetical protein HO173_003323 [Letharia columbiana]|uniref:Uncharacterized protein n=1 Tax=Letharia columbiana TaxID=112416 RepID=A0A8H6G1S3_9LECA|nr:uncharacterized protein HO173_003323 [Letharia columbiana]KAF6238816.1 hypothetical protein HO173_003323 [Letharia columbiana]